MNKRNLLYTATNGKVNTCYRCCFWLDRPVEDGNVIELVGNIAQEAVKVYIKNRDYPDTVISTTINNFSLCFSIREVIGFEYQYDISGELKSKYSKD